MYGCDFWKIVLQSSWTEDEGEVDVKSLREKDVEWVREINVFVLTQGIG